METAGRRSLRLLVDIARQGDGGQSSVFPTVEDQRGLSGTRPSTLPTGGCRPKVLR